jgi:hypothetical protein
MSFTILTLLSLNMHIAHANGRCMGICASTKLLLFWHTMTLSTMISSTIVAFGYGSNHGGLKVMFVDSKYLQVHDGSSKDEGYVQ